jgi:hypothetical protein
MTAPASIAGTETTAVQPSLHSQVITHFLSAIARSPDVSAEVSGSLNLLLSESGAASRVQIHAAVVSAIAGGENAT